MKDKSLKQEKNEYKKNYKYSAKKAVAFLFLASVISTTGCIVKLPHESKIENEYSDSEYEEAINGVQLNITFLLSKNNLMGSNYTVEDYKRLGKLTNEQIYMFCRLKPYESETFLKAQGYNSIEEYYKSLGFENKNEWTTYSRNQIVENYLNNKVR